MKMYIIARDGDVVLIRLCRGTETPLTPIRHTSTCQTYNLATHRISPMYNIASYLSHTCWEIDGTYEETDLKKLSEMTCV